jgi:hypothetical protein
MTEAQSRLRTRSAPGDGDALPGAVAAFAPGLLQSLQNLGFTLIEAQAYCALLRQPGSSGYRIAHAIGKSQGNTYTALTGLSRKGAVVAAEGAPRSYYPVPAAELFASLERRFTQDCEQARLGLETLSAPATGTAVIHFANEAEAMSRARAMLLQATSTVVYELFPTTYAALAEDFRSATRRLQGACQGVLFTAGPVDPELNAPLSTRAEPVLRALPDDTVCLVVDGRQVLYAMFDRVTGRLKDGVWSNDLLLVYLVHNGLVSDIILHRSGWLDQIGSPNLSLLGRFPPIYRDVINTPDYGDT